MRMSRGIGGLAALALGVGLGPSIAVEHHKGRTRYPKGYKPTGYGFRPHNGEREIARRKRQSERDAARQAERKANSYWGGNGHDEVVGVSRRGQPIFAQ